MITLGDVEAARERVSHMLRPTPVELSESFSALAGRQVLLKPEHRQRTGSFKIRGAYNRIAQLPSGLEVVAASAGNHAQGVALAATSTSREAVVYMPVNAALPKVDATIGYGARVVLEGADVEEAAAAAKRYAADHGAVFVPPFDDPDIIAGQGTLGLEIAEEAPEAQTVVIPVGGGGLISGVAAALRAVRPQIRIVGVEAAGAACLSAAFAAGRPVLLEKLATMADGIAIRSVSDLTFEHTKAYVDEVVTVDDEEISRSVLMLVERAKAVVEPSGAAALAAVMNGHVSGAGPVVVVLSGGNVDPRMLIRIVGHGLSVAGRYLVVRVIVTDTPGALAALATELARLDTNVLAVEHHRSGVPLSMSEVEVTVTLETRDAAHRERIVADLVASGYRTEMAG